MTLEETKQMTALATEFETANLAARPDYEVSPEKFAEFKERAKEIELSQKPPTV